MKREYGKQVFQLLDLRWDKVDEEAVYSCYLFVLQLQYEAEWSGSFIAMI